MSVKSEFKPYDNSYARVAVLMATFNRKNKTQECLDSLFCAEQQAGVNIQVFLTDACSQDYTVEMIQERFPRVEVKITESSKHWAESMAIAEQLLV